MRTTTCIILLLLVIFTMGYIRFAHAETDEEQGVPDLMQSPMKLTCRYAETPNGEIDRCTFEPRDAGPCPVGETPVKMRKYGIISYECVKE